MLDEPTNDLDLPTLGVLEEFLLNFAGCILIISHDRYFMDKIVDHLFVFEGDGIIKDYPGNFTQYRLEQIFEKRLKEEEEKQEQIVEEIILADPKINTVVKKLTFNEKRELEQLDKDLPALEAEKEQLENEMSSGNMPYDALQKASERIQTINDSLAEKEMRWLELSERN